MSVLFMVVTQQQCQGVLRLLVTPDFLWGCLGQGPVQPTLLEQRPLPALPLTIREQELQPPAAGAILLHARPWGGTALTAPGHSVCCGVCQAWAATST